MNTMTSKLPTEGRPLKMDPDLAAFLEAELAPYSGKALERAQQAIVRVRQKGVSGTWDELTTVYRDMIAVAVARDTK